MILTDYFRSEHDITWDFAKQCGVNHGVIRLPEDKKFDILSHPNIKLTADGGAVPYTHSKAGKYFRKYMVTKLNDDEEFEINQEYINKSGIEFVDLPVEAEPEEPKKQEKKQPLLKQIGKYLLRIFMKLKNKLWR